jgi:hypothetical protein
MTDQPRAAFDRIAGAIDGLPDVRKTKPSTFTDVTPILGDVSTYIVQTYQTDEGMLAFVQTIDASGSTRIVLPPKVTAALYRQRDSLIKAGRKARGKDRWERMSHHEREATVARLRKTS